MTHKVLLVDDHWVVREGLKLILETNDNYQVVGEAEHGEAALKLLEDAHPDVILLDLNMPVMNGLETLQAMRDKQVDVPVIILTTYNEDEMMLNGLRLGARGYLLKDTSRENLFRTLESAIRGETLLQPEITAKVFAAASLKQDAVSSRAEQSHLSEKELIVLRAVSRGYRSKEIAFDMGISERTVKAHLTNIYNKLGVDSRAQALAVAVERGLIRL